MSSGSELTALGVSTGFVSLLEQIFFTSWHHNVHIGSEAHLVYCLMDIKTSFLRVKQPKQEDDCSTPSSDEVKHAYSVTSLPLYALLLWVLGTGGMFLS
jgi:hypothetical protein